MKLAVGVEGGGTKTRVVLIDCEESRTIIARLFPASTNPYESSYEEVCDKVQGMINEVLEEHQGAALPFLGITSSGFNTENAYVDKFFSKYQNFLETHDSEGPLCAFEAEFNRKAAVIIAGTGNAGFFKGMVGGLGHLLNEKGCGFSAVRSAIEEICMIKDGFSDPVDGYEDVWQSFCKYHKFKSTEYNNDELFELFYNENFVSKVAAFNRTLCSMHNDFVEQIYTEEFRYIGQLIKILRTRGEFADVVCVGSFWLSLNEQKSVGRKFFNDFAGLKFWCPTENAAAIGIACESARASWHGETLFEEFALSQ